MTNPHILRLVELVTEAGTDSTPHIVLNGMSLDPYADEDVELLRPFAKVPNMVRSLTTMRNMIDAGRGCCT
jgi:hypothetical protein